MEWEKRWPHFAPEEVFSPDLLAVFRDRNVIPYSAAALDELEHIRVMLGSPILVNHAGMHLRGGRSPREILSLNHSKQKPENSYSFHSWCAFDISVPDLPLEELLSFIKTYSHFRGIGVYKSFLHVDLRSVLDGKLVIWQGET